MLLPLYPADANMKAKGYVFLVRSRNVSLESLRKCMRDVPKNTPPAN
ncbi:hypothetical protein HanXRQr2_Chr05g0198391 [Helianthus annuus]|uniref:Uncharacterized protein n=1 Tax=Helianthus annuus TaxID=4232 RepID=A0A9K3IXH7_HELAN|nr:hypothetical protein HanXRQr2_Chr05g0198391 [Helianthus annuus]